MSSPLRGQRPRPRRRARSRPRASPEERPPARPRRASSPAFRTDDRPGPHAERRLPLLRLRPTPRSRRASSRRRRPRRRRGGRGARRRLRSRSSPGPSPRPARWGPTPPCSWCGDPTTLFVFWDFRRELERGAALGLREPRLLLRLHRGADLDRTLELPLTSRSTYVAGLTSGQEYTAEVLLLGRDGWTRPVGSRSAGRRLPPGRVSTQLEVRTLRLPWSEPLSGAPAPSAAAAPRHEPLDSPRRVPLPTSPGARGSGDRSGQSGDRGSGRN